MNEYLIEAMKAGVRGKWLEAIRDRTYFHMSLQNLQARDILTKQYAWAIPTDEALAVLKEHEPLIEIGAGKGYWASLLDGDIICFDCHANNPSINDNVDSGPVYHKVYRGGHNRIKDYPDRTLFLCWPPYDTEMAGDCLKAYTGDVFIFIGEGNGGCTGGTCFWDQIEEEWDEEKYLDLPQWSGLNDNMTVFRRKVKLTKQEIRAILDEVSIKHTNECRESPGNVKGSGGHWPPNGPLDMGGYRCVCDWMDRVKAHHKEMKK